MFANRAIVEDAMSLIRSLHIDHMPVRPDALRVPEMSLSSARERMVRHSFVSTAHAATLVNVLGPAYADLVSELKSDLSRRGAPLDELDEAGYPELRQVIENPSLLDLVIGAYLRDEFFGKQTSDDSGRMEYWLDDVKECRLSGELVYVSGVCYSRAPQ